MFKSKILYILSFLAIAAIGFTGCNEDPCDGVDCGASGVPIEDTVFGTCECECDAGFVVSNGTCVEDGCAGVDCGLGEATLAASGDCFCDCPEGTNNDAGTGCVLDFDCEAEGNCVNGECVNNACECDDNYEGENCDEASVAKFIGTWSITETCVAENEVPGVCISYEDTYTFTITENGLSIMDVQMNNFLGVDSDGDAFIPFLIADIDGSNIEVTTQASTSEFYNYNTSGSGVYSVTDEGVEIVTYDFTVNEMDEAGNSTCVVNCSSVWTKN